MPPLRARAWLTLATAALLSRSAADFTAHCPQPCECKWQSGNKAAACAGSNLKAVPQHLSDEIQNLELSNNPLRQLAPHAFKRAGLGNLKKLVLRECILEAVHEAAFDGLGIMIELDLSRNRIRSLRAPTFRETEKLRWINLSNNLLERLEDGLFRNLKFLQKVELSNNRLARVGTASFVNLPRLQILRLDGNNLTHMRLEPLGSLALSSLDLHNNPWRCDCNLQSFRNWVIGHNLYTPPTSCAEPPALEDRLWSELDSSSFACRPTILEPAPDATLRPRHENVTLACKVVGNPTPEVTWKFNSRPMSPSERRYVFADNSLDLIRWVNVTIVQARPGDRGQYTCAAENPGGRDERNVTLVLARYAGDADALAGDALAVLFGCVCSAVIASVLVAAACYCTARRRDSKRLLKPEAHSPNGDTLIDASGGSELEKSFAGDVNPVSKPPRRYDAPPSVTSEATEMSELNRTLLDGDSVLASTEDNSQVQECEAAMRLSRELLLQRHREPAAYPPDLLSFPLRTQLAPAQHATAASPTRSPPAGYGPSLSVFGSSVGFARFQSPFTQGCSGYVTLPRHPRAPAWSDAHAELPFTTIDGVPYYDNLGVRISVDGGTYLALNKSDAELASGKPFQLASVALEESEPAPSPAPGTPHATAPRASASSPNIHNQLLALQAITASSLALQHAYARRAHTAHRAPHDAQSATAAGAGALASPTESESLIAAQEKREVIRMTGGTAAAGGGRKKTPPKAPPKPKKKSSELKEPFLDSAGEKATQV